MDITMTDKPPHDTSADLATALQALDDLVLSVEFDSKELESVEAAMRAVETTIDGAMAGYRGHPLVESAIAHLKAKCRAALHAGCAEAFNAKPSPELDKPRLH